MATRCYYDVLGVRQDATPGEVKKSYHTLALRWHPDKNAGNDEATEMFKQVQEAYEVLADPVERAYYDDNRDVLLADEDEDEPEVDEVEAELDVYKWLSRDAFVDFTGAEDGFFAVYSAVFRDLHQQERTARNATNSHRPDFGSANSGEATVTDFYAYWLNFTTCRSDRAFSKHDKWDLNEAPSPLMRRLMQQKNKVIRDKARKMFDDKVRRLVRWVKTQDPRPCGRIDVPEAGGGGDDVSREENATFHCAACNKWYKNAAQLSNHEKSGKHKQMVAKVKQQLSRDVAEDVDLVELEELGLEGASCDDGAGAEHGAHGGGGGDTKGAGGKGKKKKGGRRGAPAEGDGADDIAVDDEGDAAMEAELAAASTALPSPGLVALQTRQAFESTDEYKKMNKTQRRKALQQWEAENEHIMAALRAEGKEPKPEAEPKEKKPEVKAPKEKVHGSGAHSREIKTPKKKKAVYMGGGNKVVQVE